MLINKCDLSNKIDNVSRGPSETYRGSLSEISPLTVFVLTVGKEQEPQEALILISGLLSTNGPNGFVLGAHKNSFAVILIVINI